MDVISEGLLVKVDSFSEGLDVLEGKQEVTIIVSLVTKEEKTRGVSIYLKSPLVLVRLNTF